MTSTSLPSSSRYARGSRVISISAWCAFAIVLVLGTLWCVQQASVSADAQSAAAQMTMIHEKAAASLSKAQTDLPKAKIAATQADDAERQALQALETAYPGFDAGLYGPLAADEARDPYTNLPLRDQAAVADKGALGTTYSEAVAQVTTVHSAVTNAKTTLQKATSTEKATATLADVATVAAASAHSALTLRIVISVIAAFALLVIAAAFHLVRLRAATPHP